MCINYYVCTNESVRQNGNLEFFKVNSVYFSSSVLKYNPHTFCLAYQCTHTILNSIIHGHIWLYFNLESADCNIWHCLFYKPVEPHLNSMSITLVTVMSLYSNQFACHFASLKGCTNSSSLDTIVYHYQLNNLLCILGCN